MNTFPDGFNWNLYLLTLGLSLLFSILETDSLESSFGLYESTEHKRSLSIYLSTIITPQMLLEVSQYLLVRICSIADK